MENQVNYQPKINDYVRWKHLEGWIYFVGELYITIEIMVREKSEQSYKDCNLHRNERCLVLCFPEQYDELEYIKTRRSNQSTYASSCVTPAALSTH